MIPLAIYLQPEVDLLLGYNQFRQAVGYALRIGADESGWTTQQAAELDRDVQEAYRWCLRPATIPGYPIPHIWSWLEQTTTLTTVSGDYDYTLPSNFGSFVGQYMIWPSQSGYDPPCMTNDTEILMLRSDASQDGRPQKFALRWRAQVSGQDQRRELIFWPTPDAAYVLTYKYAIRTGVLSKTNPYPLGGQDMSQLMIEACKAIGENKRNGTRGDQWNVFMAALQSAVMLDKAENTTPTVGIMGGGGTRYEQIRGDTSYWFGPYSDGSYVLEV